MNLDFLGKIRNAIYHGLGYNICIAVGFIILLLVATLTIFSGYYYQHFTSPEECCGDSIQPLRHSEYGYYSITNFFSGNELYLDKEGLTHTNYYSGALNLTYYPDNQTWALHNSIDDAIPFKIVNPATGAQVEGIFTPNISVMNDTFSTDILVVNWNNSAQKGSCYQIISSTSRPYDHFCTYNEGPLEKNRIPTGVNQYDEIRVDLTPYKPPANTTPWADNIDLRYHQENIIAEKNCTAQDKLTTGSWTTVGFSLERR